MQDKIIMEKTGLTVISNGAGQETSYFIIRACNDKDFYDKHIVGDIVVVGSDTGNEHEHTYENVEFLRRTCELYDIPFFWITNDMGFHSYSWMSLTHQFNKNCGIGSAAFPQSCTDKLKVSVVDKFVDWYIQHTYGCTGKRKNAYYDFKKKFGKIRLILGFAKGEEHRTKNADKYDAVWKLNCVYRYYPLMVDGISRQDCIDYFDSHNLKIYPSNCIFCFYQSEQELLWLWRNYPLKFAEWAQIEANKLNKYKDAPGKNLGVYGNKTLWEKLEIAIQKYGHWTKDQLDEYKYSHGHCIKSKF